MSRKPDEHEGRKFLWYASRGDWLALAEWVKGLPDVWFGDVIMMLPVDQRQTAIDAISDHVQY